MPKVEGLKNVSESAEQAPEKLTLDPEVMEQLDALGRGIKSKEDLLAGLGRLARENRETMLSGDAEAEEEISAPREVGRVDLKAEHDAQNFESAEKRGWWKRFWLKEPKHNMAGKDGVMVDTRKLKPEVKEGIEKGQTKFFPGELEEAAEKLGLTSAEIKAGGFSMDYVEGKNGMEKMLKRAATPEEGDKAAAAILERQLKEQEQAGADLAKQRASLEAFRKEQESIQDMIKPEDLPVLAEKEQSMEKEIQDKQTNIDNYKKDRLPQLQEHRDFTEEALRYSTEKLEEATTEENKFGKEIEGIEEKIKRLKGAKQMLALFGDKIVEFEEQKAKAKLHKQAFIDAKQTLRQNINTLNRNKVEVDKTLERINKIGKTSAELKAEREEEAAEKAKLKQAQEAQKAARQPTTAAGTDGLSTGGEAGERTTEPAKTVVEVPIAAGQEEEGAADLDDYLSDDDIDVEGKRQQSEEQRQQAIDREMSTTNWREAKKEKIVPGLKREPVISLTADAGALETSPAEGRGAERRETKVVRPIRFWLNTIFEGYRLPADKEKVMMKHFNIKELSEQELSVEITLEKAQKAYAGYIIDLIRLGILEPRNAWEQAAEVVKDIVKNIDKYDREEEEVAALKRGNPAPGEASASAQNQTEATGGKKPAVKKEKKSPDGGRSNKNLIERKLAEAELKDHQTPLAAEDGGAKGSRKKKGPPLETIIENPPINGVGGVLEQALAQAEKKAEKSADTAKSAETNPESATKPEQSAEERARMELLAEAVREELKDGKSNGRVERVIKRNFGSAKKPLVMETEDQLVKAIVGYMMDLGNGNREAAETVARAKLEAIKQKIKL